MTELDSEDDDEYWGEFGMDMDDLQDADGDVSMEQDREGSGDEGAKAAWLKKRCAMAMKRRAALLSIVSIDTYSCFICPLATPSRLLFQDAEPF